ncbi:hypothetical protein GGI20_006273 [Coemansia sp. BCRC 34301]|nr:hypothetical protein GGI20_006273 [Coemansia sp. BCRC 34301]
MPIFAQKAVVTTEKVGHAVRTRLLHRRAPPPTAIVQKATVSSASPRATAFLITSLPIAAEAEPAVAMAESKPAAIVDLAVTVSRANEPDCASIVAEADKEAADIAEFMTEIYQSLDKVIAALDLMEASDHTTM